MREMKGKVGNVGARYGLNRVGWSMVACLSVDDTVICKKCRGTAECGG